MNVASSQQFLRTLPIVGVYPRGCPVLVASVLNVLCSLLLQTLDHLLLPALEWPIQFWWLMSYFWLPFPDSLQFPCKLCTSNKSSLEESPRTSLLNFHLPEQLPGLEKNSIMQHISYASCYVQIKINVSTAFFNQANSNKCRIYMLYIFLANMGFCFVVIITAFTIH